MAGKEPIGIVRLAGVPSSKTSPGPRGGLTPGIKLLQHSLPMQWIALGGGGCIEEVVLGRRGTEGYQMVTHIGLRFSSWNVGS